MKGWLLTHRKEVEAQKSIININLSLIPVILACCIEISSFLDFVSDLMIVITLGSSNDTSWFAFTLFTIICPYYSVYTSLINKQIENIRLKRKEGLSLFNYLGILILILPTMFVLLIKVDLLFMITSVIAYPSILISHFFFLGPIFLEFYERL